MYTEFLSFKTPFMKSNSEYASRPVKIKLKNSSNKVEGNMIFGEPGERRWVAYGECAHVKFRCNDATKTEIMVNLMDVDMIDYL